MIKSRADILHLPIDTLLFRYNQCRLLLEAAKRRKGFGGWRRKLLEQALAQLQDDRP